MPSGWAQRNPAVTAAARSGQSVTPAKPVFLVAGAPGEADGGPAGAAAWVWPARVWPAWVWAAWVWAAWVWAAWVWAAWIWAAWIWAAWIWARMRGPLSGRVR